MSKRKLEIEILMNIKKAIAAYEQLKGESEEFSADVVEDFVKVRNAMAQGGYDEAKAALEDYSNSALMNFQRIQAQLEQFDTDEAQQEYIELMKTSDSFSDEAVEDFLKIQKASNNLADEAVEDFMRMRMSMDEVTESSRQMGSGVSGMASQFTYMLSDAPMLLMDVRMGMMGIMNNIQPMMTMWGQNAAKMGGNLAVMKSLASTMMGPAGLAAAISAVVFVGPKLIDWLKKDKKAAEEAKKAHEELAKAIKNIRELTETSAVKDRIDQKKRDIEIDKIKRQEIEAQKKELQSLKEEYQLSQEQINKYKKAKEAAENVEAYRVAQKWEQKLKTEKKEQSGIMADIKALATSLSIEFKNISDYQELITAIKDKEKEITDEIASAENQIVELRRQRERTGKIEAENAERTRKELELTFDIINRIQVGMQELEKRDVSWDIDEENIDVIQAVKDELPVVTGLFDRFGSTAQQAVNNTSDAMEILKRTVISTGIEVASLIAMFKALKFFGGDVFSGVGLGDFLLNQLFGKPLDKVGGGVSGAADTAAQNVDVAQIQRAINERPVEVSIDGGKIPIEGIMKGRDIYLINEKAKKELA